MGAYGGHAWFMACFFSSFFFYLYGLRAMVERDGQFLHLNPVRLVSGSDPSSGGTRRGAKLFISDAGRTKMIAADDGFALLCRCRMGIGSCKDEHMANKGNDGRQIAMETGGSGDAAAARSDYLGGVWRWRCACGSSSSWRSATREKQIGAAAVRSCEAILHLGQVERAAPLLFTIPPPKTKTAKMFSSKLKIHWAL